MAELIYSTKEVFTTYLKDRTFKIPEYQRGYKWSDKQIAQLVLDIHDFDATEDENLFYCLQNITLYPSTKNEKVLHIVDGQQRLTTTYLLFCYLGLHEYLSNKFFYAVRASSDRFIQEIQLNNLDFLVAIKTSDTFENFCDQQLNEDFDHQDIFYMYSAIKTFDNLFLTAEYNIQKEQFTEKLKHNVKFIVNEIHSNIKEQELFMNLNTGKVPLDGADLVRAIIITRVAKEEMVNYRNDVIKDIVRLNEKRTRIGWELDQLNQWWSEEKVKHYFSPFVKIETDPQETIQFDEEINPINILYKLWVETKVKPKEKLRLKLFENGNISSLELYRELIFLNRTLKDWFEDREIYHYLGILANNSRGFAFQKYYERWLEPEETRQNFLIELKKDIKLFIFGQEDKDKSGSIYWREHIKNYEGENKTNWYDLKELEKFLILIDVIEISQNPSIPFLSPLHFKKNNEDKEHIYPCTPKNIKELGKSDNDFDAINNFLKQSNLNDTALFPFSEKQWKTKSDFEKEDFLKELESKIHQLTPINSLGNLVLLHYSINRGFGNDYYIDKRASVVNNVQNGEYVRQHTLSVFVKGRSSTINLNNWTFADICENADSIEEKIRVFFDLKKIEDEEPTA
ncbi:DUF262 domain-containing protein [Chryseobacterium sp. Leaf180]|uniref:DUF262 domain-containing protein n=1 Tax=Chryseobacterium sp. Leaf180 TaxID=1736289 RepID=UPI000A6BF829|nr:DUF262 domain-containing protein [Chryseobacterium sp. Leaf180]